MKVIIADDHTIVRSGLKHMLELQYPDGLWSGGPSLNMFINQGVYCEWQLDADALLWRVVSYMPGSGGA